MIEARLRFKYQNVIQKFYEPKVIEYFALKRINLQKYFHSTQILTFTYNLIILRNFLFLLITY